MNTEDCEQHKKPEGHAEPVEPKRPGDDLPTHAGEVAPGQCHALEPEPKADP